MEALGINVPGLVTQIISFLVLFGVLYAFLYKPLLRILDQRSARIREGLEQAESARADAERSRSDMVKQVEEARAEGQGMISQAREAAERFREEELRKAREEIESERVRAQSSIQRERNAAIEELRSEFAGLAISAAERVVEKSLDEPTHRELINKILEEGPKVRGS